MFNTKRRLPSHELITKVTQGAIRSQHRESGCPSQGPECGPLQVDRQPSAPDMFSRRDTISLTCVSVLALAVPGHLLDHAYCSGPDEGSETPELLLPVPQSASPLPQHATVLPSHLATRVPHPSSLLLHLPPSPDRPPSVPRGETHLPQVHFLQALLSLQRANGPLCFGADGGALLVDSVCCLLVSVVRLCRDAPPLGPGESVLQACHVSASSMEMFCSHRLPDEDFRRRVEAALRDLTEMLLHNKGIHRVSSKVKGVFIYAQKLQSMWENRSDQIFKCSWVFLTPQSIRAELLQQRNIDNQIQKQNIARSL